MQKVITSSLENEENRSFEDRNFEFWEVMTMKENINIVAMSFYLALNHGLWYTVNKAD